MSQANAPVTGYMHPDYAASLAEFGQMRHLSGCNGWLLDRPIPGSEQVDGIGCYPFFTCERWSQLEHDLEASCQDLVSLALVTDPFGAYDVTLLRRCFPDRVSPFKEHFVVDLDELSWQTIARHHQRNVKKSLKIVDVERCEQPWTQLEPWIALYDNLIERHAISGIAAFSRQAFALQLRLPGVSLFRALHAGKIVGMILWYQQQDIAYYHLAAYAPSGYQMRASYALFWNSIQYFQSRNDINWLNLGAGAGLDKDAPDGLTRFKRGWANGTRTAYFCGRIFDKVAYNALLEETGSENVDYFPAYRLGEFG